MDGTIDVNDVAKSTKTSDRGGRLCFICCCFVLFCSSIILLVGYDYYTNTHYPYSVVVDDSYPFPLTTKKFGIEFYVKSRDKFDRKYAVGTSKRSKIEDKIIEDYLYYANNCCQDEQEWHQVRPDFPTPTCDKLQSLGINGSRL
ncbi:hypothetical protein M8C21_004685 [Ambrosia artemisiifolia]|uniref:DUF1977 domain-containing protein n=1 Tax=Ambrosia artemisiifolia TaxID=4212 RepID=A0AAD5CR15_AMBAR|nr:hypothetical protein M8C21_004685 [Ambrosia artemisiifolia]